jgi:hypothetical protein
MKDVTQTTSDGRPIKLGREKGKIYCCNWPDTGVCNCLEALRLAGTCEWQTKRIKELEKEIECQKKQ